LKDHANATPDLSRVDVGIVDVLAAETRSFMRLKLRSTVLLPQPDGPISAVILRRAILRPTSLTAWKPP
jgi:hypothetical protein